MNNIIKTFEDFLIEEGGETTSIMGNSNPFTGVAEFAGPTGGAGFAGVSVDGGSSAQGTSGTAVSTLGNTSGMGNVVSPQPSATPGAVNAVDATKGSGDIGSKGGTYMKSFPKRKNTKKKKKRKKKYSELGAKIDKYYTSNYSEKYTKDGKVIQSWKTFNEIMNNEKV